MPNKDKSSRTAEIKFVIRILVLFLLLGLYLWAEETAEKIDDSLLLGALIIYCFWFAYHYLTPVLNKFVSEKALKQDNARNFMVLWRYAWLGTGLIFLAISFSGSLAALGVSAAVLAMVLGWSLQAPVTGIAAWLMIIIRRPFKVGDRVVISGITGDVADINLTHTILRQVGGAVPGEELSGRVAMIPNLILFQQTIVNYTRESPYNLDEVQVSISNRSDITQAQEILLKAAREATAPIIRETSREPFVRVEISDKGITLRLRYQTLVQERQKISSEIITLILREIGNPQVSVELSQAPKEILNSPKKAGTS